MGKHSITKSIAGAVAVLLVAGCAAGVPSVGGIAVSPGSLPGSAPCAVSTVAESIPDAGVMFGVNLDWGAESLAQFADKLGKRPEVAVSFATFPMDAQTVTNVNAAADQVRMNGGTLLLTLEPHQGLAAVTDAVARDLAALVRPFNDTGVSVIVRFAHEMNGSWYEWGQQPIEYVDAFRRVAAALRKDAPATAMMWAPNYGGGYPYIGGAFEAGAGESRFELLDTNADGVLTMADDPYEPYYPGDDVVDWVGMSLYHWGSKYPWGENEMPEPGKFAAQLTGEYNGLNGDDRATPDFYQRYGVDRGMPVAIPETAALFAPSEFTIVADELAIKQAWWRQVVSDETVAQFPQLHMVNWFEWNKVESEVGAAVDWTITSSPEILDSFSADVPASLLFADGPSACEAK